MAFSAPRSTPRDEEASVFCSRKQQHYALLISASHTAGSVQVAARGA